ncbi:MAG: hypothetical protein ACOYB2_07825 [Limnohabitans sp.]
MTLLFRNSLLDLMLKEAPANLAGSLDSVVLPQGPFSLASTHRYVYFPRDALLAISQIHRVHDAVDVAVVGHHTCIGPAELWGVEMQAVVMEPGQAYRLDWSRMKQSPKLYNTWLWRLTSVIHGLIEQMAQTAFCATHHNTTQRLSSWLLICLAQHGGTSLTLPLDVLPTSLRQQEQALQAALNHLQSIRAIALSDAGVQVLDAERLARVACRCHNMVTHDIAQRQPQPL